MFRPLILSIAPLLLFAAPAPAADRAASRVSEQGEAKLAKLLEGRTPGKPTNCIMNRNLTSSRIIDGTAIVYETPGRGTIYVNRPSIGAESLHEDDILVTKSYTSQLCSLDNATLLDRGSRIQRGFVSLGEFVPYTRPRR